MHFSAHIEDWELKQPFRIAGMEWKTTRSVVVQLADSGHIGRGEAQGVFYMDENADTVLAQVNAAADKVRSGITREELLDYMPAGGARNAIDCALWDLECKRSGKTIWELTDIEPGPVTTVFTIGMESTPEAMAEKPLPLLMPRC